MLTRSLCVPMSSEETNSLATQELDTCHAAPSFTIACPPEVPGMCAVFLLHLCSCGHPTWNSLPPHLTVSSCEGVPCLRHFQVA